MSEFSQSYHVVTDDAETGAALLRDAGLTGWVFPASNGWVTVLPDPDEFGTPSPALVAANAGTLLYYLNAEDHGWTFTIWERGEQVCAYGCAWDHTLDVQDKAYDAAVIDRIIASNSLDAEAAHLQIDRLLHPESLQHLFAYYTHTEGRNPGHGFAEAIGLEHFHWLSSDYVSKDGGRVIDVDLVRVG